jgi:nucleoside-diphosphate-sugar epimerase
VRAITNPGRRGIGHAWAFLPDVGETFARLMDDERRLGPFERFHFEGFWDEDGDGMARALRSAAGGARIPIRAFPWAALPLLAPFSESLRETWEMKPLWRAGGRLDNRRLTAWLGAEPRTPIDQAAGRTLATLGCLA